MSTRRYAGASGKCELSAVPSLPARYALQPKMDGAYCVVATDSSGAIAAMVTRAGKPVRKDILADFDGVTFAPDSVLIGEVEGYTDAGKRAAARAGYHRCWLFDALRIGGADFSQTAYGDRRAALMRASAWLQDEGSDRPWTDDVTGRAHDSAGRFVRRIPGGWRRLPVVPQVHSSHVDSAWADWVERGQIPCEGLVAVAQDAPIGRRRSKLKIKQVSTLDVVCLDADKRHARMLWREAGVTFLVGCRKGLQMRKGGLYEVAHESFYDSGEPRFARLVRARDDLRA